MIWGHFSRINNFRRPSRGKNKFQETFPGEKLISKGLPREKISKGLLGKKHFKRLLQEKINFKRPSPGKNKFQKAFPREKWIHFRFFLCPPQIINGRPLSYSWRTSSPLPVYPCGRTLQSSPAQMYSHKTFPLISCTYFLPEHLDNVLHLLLH